MIDFSFISKLEGFETSGYVPEPDGGEIESGVTVASGFDIGQRSVEEIDDNFDCELADKLAPYCGVTGHEAMVLIKHEPLELSKEECITINEYAHKQAISRLMTEWVEHGKVAFASLHPATQTVIASVAFQYGELSGRTPNFWRQATSQDYDGMLANLCNFGDRFKTRRRKEARYLFNALNEYGEYESLSPLIL